MDVSLRVDMFERSLALFCIEVTVIIVESNNNCRSSFSTELNFSPILYFTSFCTIISLKHILAGDWIQIVFHSIQYVV